MKRLLILIPFLFLMGCDDVPVTTTWPEVPAELKTACPGLQDVKEGTVKLSEVIDVVVENYSQYHMCQVKVDAWIEWYNAQKKIHEELK
jgi:hypothetical protein